MSNNKAGQWMRRVKRDLKLPDEVYDDKLRAISRGMVKLGRDYEDFYRMLAIMFKEILGEGGERRGV